MLSLWSTTDQKQFPVYTVKADSDLWLQSKELLHLERILTGNRTGRLCSRRWTLLRDSAAPSFLTGRRSTTSQEDSEGPHGLFSLLRSGRCFCCLKANTQTEEEFFPQTIWAWRAPEQSSAHAHIHMFMSAHIKHYPLTHSNTQIIYIVYLYIFNLLGPELEWQVLFLIDFWNLYMC